MKLFRFRRLGGDVRVGVVDDDGRLVDVTAPGTETLAAVLEHPDPVAHVRRALVAAAGMGVVPQAVQVLAPIDRQEVWAAGVTYLRSKTARMEESDFSATAYDRVYDADRPELFFKSLPEKAVGPKEAVGIRLDARWNVPEPELALVTNSRGRLVGYTIGNDMSSRDIEGENLLYLPQAKVYDRSCAVGPCIRIGATEAEAREWTITLRIVRKDALAFTASTSVNQIKRRLEDLAAWLFRSQTFPHGAVLLTGTGIVPPDSFSLAGGDVVHIEIDGVGTLENPVIAV